MKLRLLGATAVFVNGGIPLIALGVRSLAENRAFSVRAMSVNGRVVGFERWEPSGGADIDEHLHYAVVRYRTAEGREIRFRGPSKDGLPRLRQGDVVRVLYDPSSPETARVDSFMGLWFSATMLCGIGAGAILVPLLTWRQARKWAKGQAETLGGN